MSNRLRRSAEAERALRRALELNPNFALAHAMLGASLGAKGLHQEAIERAELAMRLSPNDRGVGMFALLALMGGHFGAGRYAECAIWSRRMIESNPEHIGGYQYLAATLAAQGEVGEAAEVRDALLRLRPEMSLAWIKENLPPTGEFAERVYEALRKAGIPEA